MTPDRATLLRGLDPIVVQEHLRTRGWRVVEPDAADQRYVVYERGGVALDLPLRPSDRDYARRVEELITTVAAVDGISADDLLDELGQLTVTSLGDVEVTGVVVRLERKARSLDAPGEIEIVPTGGLFVEAGRVIVVLAPPDYMKAIEAHAAAVGVRVRGTLERHGRRWVLTAARGFTCRSREREVCGPQLADHRRIPVARWSLPSGNSRPTAATMLAAWVISRDRRSGVPAHHEPAARGAAREPVPAEHRRHRGAGGGANEAAPGAPRDPA